MQVSEDANRNILRDGSWSVLFGPNVILLPEPSPACAPTHDGDKLLVARRTTDRRFDRAHHLDSQPGSKLQHFVNCPTTLRIVTHHPALAHLALAYFELRFD